MDPRGALGYLLSDRRAFIENLIKVEDKARQIRPFRLNPIQDLAWPSLASPGTRGVILKPSQVGFSSLVIALFLVDTICVPGTTSIIVAHEEFITQRLLARAQFYYDQLPEEFKPRMSHKSANEKFFPDINSVLYIGSARAHVFGRSEPIHNFLADEYAFWPEPERIMVPALQRITPLGRCIVGSTPNGEDNAFHDLYVQAKGGNSVWQPHFYPWFLHPEYRLPPGHPLARPSDREELQSLDEQEEALVLRGVDEDQLRWRRAKRAELEALSRTGETKLLFGQEFPEDDTSCFITAGDMVHDATILDNMSKMSFPAPHSYLGAQVWEQPKPGASYVVAIDPGQGKFTESAITVWRQSWDQENNRYHLYHCATRVGRFDVEVTAKEADSLARYYNTAMIAPEANSHGLAVISELKNVLRYPRLYYRVDFVQNTQSINIGWLTTPTSKPYMVKETGKALFRMTCYDNRIISQARNVRYMDQSKRDVYVHLGLSDLYMSMALAVVTIGEANQARGFAGTGGWPSSWGNIRSA